MKFLSKIGTIVPISALALSLMGCSAPAFDHATAACNAYDSVVDATKGSDIDAIVSAHAALVATLSVWQTEGGEPLELSSKISGYSAALGGFIATVSPEDAKRYTDYEAAEGSNIEALCSEARG